MRVSKGQNVWVPCKAKKGPFPDERVVLVGSSVVFVREPNLKDPNESETHVRAMVTEVGGGKFKARIQGQAVNSKVYAGYEEEVGPGDIVKTGNH